MPVCLSCSMWGRGPLCRDCRSLLRPAGDVVLPNGLRVTCGYVHTSVARRLVHLLKYQGMTVAADALAAGVADRIPSGAAALVPVPRATLRRVRHGIDPAVALARGVGRLTGIPVVEAIGARLWWPRHAGRDRLARGSPGFRLRGSVPGRAFLVDDVLTTGATLSSAAEVSGVVSAITGTCAGIPTAR